MWGKSPISIEESVEEVITELRDTMPEGLEFTIWDSRAEAYRGRMSLVASQRLAWTNTSLYFIKLFLEMRLAFWVMLGIPISFLGTFIFMSGADVSLNMITMFAFLFHWASWSTMPL